MINNDLFSLEGSVSLVTGGAGLIGKSICEALAKAGSTVYVADIDNNRATEVATNLEGPSRAVSLDITDEDSVRDAMEIIESDEGRMDTLVNSAYPKNEEFGKPYEEVSLASWKQNVNDHLGGYFYTIQQAIPLLSKVSPGSIVNIGSIYGSLAPDPRLYHDTDKNSPVEYSAIKGGLINMTRYFASYLGEKQIRVNCVSPGGIFDDQPETFVKRYNEKTPLERMARPDDIAGAIVFLASEAAGYITGQNLLIDGGYTIT